MTRKSSDEVRVFRWFVGVVLVVVLLGTLGTWGSYYPPTQAQVQPVFVDVEVTKVYDGDTITVNLPGVPDLFGRKLGVRIKGIDTPEIRGKCPLEKELAIQAREFVKTMMVGAYHKVTLVHVSRGKYFRIVATVIADGQSVGEALLKEGLAVVYDGGTKVKDWCAPTLHIPESPDDPNHVDA